MTSGLSLRGSEVGQPQRLRPPVAPKYSAKPTVSSMPSSRTRQSVKLWRSGPGPAAYSATPTARSSASRGGASWLSGESKTCTRAVEAVGDIDTAVEVDGKALRKAKLGAPAALAAKPARKRAVGFEHRDSVIGLFGDVHPRCLIDRNPDGISDLGRGRGETPKLPFRREYLDTISKRVGHVDQARRADGNPIRRAELTRLSTAAAPRSDERAIRLKFLDTVVESVGDVDKSVGVDRDSPWRVELAWTTPATAPGVAEGAIPREDLNPPMAAVDDVQQPVRAYGNALGPGEKSSGVALADNGEQLRAVRRDADEATGARVGDE